MPTAPIFGDMQQREKAAFWLSLAGSLAVLVVGAFGSNVGAGGGDGDMHYLFARFAFQHPENLLNQWGKPFFTLMFMLPTQLGFVGAVAMNITLTALAGVWMYLAGRRAGLQHAWLLIPFTMLATSLAQSSVSAMTEPLCAAMLAGVVLLYYRQQYMWAAVVLSFAPFVRSEGFALILPLAAAYLLEKRWRALPGLLVGTVVYGVVGAFATGKPLWVFAANPYVWQQQSIYGHGSPWHYFRQYDRILGLPLTFLFLLGLVAGAIRVVKSFSATTTAQQRRTTWVELLWIYGSFLGFFIMHAYIWWKGMWGSLGLERVFAAVVPYAAWIALRGWELLWQKRSLAGRTYQIAVGLLLFLIVWTPFRNNSLPNRTTQEDPELIRLASWMRQEGSFKGRTLYYLPPKLSLLLPTDHFDEKQHIDCWSWNAEKATSGSWLIWETHFAPVECSIPLDTVLQDSTLRVVYHQTPLEPFTASKDLPYEIYVFEKK